MDAIKHLADYVWKHPRDYGGFSPDGDYVIVTKTRDSDALERSNWECIVRDMGAEAWDAPMYSDEFAEAWRTRPNVYHWRARHWACGWVEYMTVRSDAPDNVLRDAGKIVSALADYPIYSEDHFSELEYTEACDAWAQLSVAERVDLCRGARISIFAARRDDMPSDDCGYILEYLRG